MPVIYMVTFTTTWTELGLCVDSRGFCVPVIVTKSSDEIKYFTESDLLTHVLSPCEGDGVSNIFLWNSSLTE